MAAEAGFSWREAPTYSQLIDYCKSAAVHDDEGNLTREGIYWRYGADQAWLGQTFYGIMIGTGVKMVDDDGIANFDTPEALGVAQLIHDTMHVHNCSNPLSKQVTPPEGVFPLQNDSGAAEWLWPGSGAAFISYANDNPDFADKWAKAWFAPKPDEGGVNAIYSAADAWSVLSASPNQELAFEFLALMASPEIVGQFFKNHPMARDDVMTSQEVVDYYAENAPGTPGILDMWFDPETAAALVGPVLSPRAQEVRQVLVDALIPALEDPDTDMAAVMASVQQQAEEVLARP